MAETGEREQERTLRALEARLERATAAAERLLAEAQEAAAGDEDAAGDAATPPRGWQRRAPADAGASRPWEGWVDAEEAELLLGVLASLRELVPRELQQRLATALRELLLAVRALIDWCLERSEHQRATPADVQDIPIL